MRPKEGKCYKQYKELKFRACLLKVYCIVRKSRGGYKNTQKLLLFKHWKVKVILNESL